MKLLERQPKSERQEKDRKKTRKNLVKLLEGHKKQEKQLYKKASKNLEIIQNARQIFLEKCL